MLGTTLRTLREPRYFAFSLLMVLVALICVGAGSWQIIRFDGKVHDNDALTGNARKPAVPVGALLPLVGARAPSADAVRYRTITAHGTYDPSGQRLVRLRNAGDSQGYWVLTPLRTKSGVLLVVRGFVAQRADGTPPPTIAAAPAGAVTVRARVETADTRHDSGGGIPAGQLWSVNPVDQAARLGTPVYDGYGELLADQPGTSGLTVIPGPDLSNPAGGAVEPQHFAYIIQWYLFAILALAAPLAMARAERREAAADEGDLDAPPAERPAPVAVSVDQAPPERSAAEIRAAKLADRYGRPVR